MNSLLPPSILAAILAALAGYSAIDTGAVTAAAIAGAVGGFLAGSGVMSVITRKRVIIPGVTARLSISIGILFVVMAFTFGVTGL